MALKWRMKEIETPKIPLPIIVGIAVALIVFAGSFYFLQKKMAQESQTIMVPVAKNLIVQGKQLESQDIDYKPYKVMPDNCAGSEAEIVGKIASANIFKGEPFRKERLADAFTDKQYVALNVDLARSGLVKAGDLADIYLLRDDTSWAYLGELVASNAVVADVRDVNGQPAADGKIPAVVQVLVKAEEVPKIVRGSGYQNKSYALVKKQAESQPAGGVPNVVQAQPAAGEQTQNVPGNR
ncbi:MAG: SAF domain-containing protein [Syntrophothermus sp.]|uniref:SAF domain-containing protein n=1 Tax=Syntrophothermus sp. TaxID=2736299 RepID=UPI00257C374F|nr:SAF domain-containing protein [Syntrophothermus sp.]NSW82725.1 SAF domain-containing protein [Syntrophothermus sp.]